MNFYIRNNPSYFKINEIDLPKRLIRDYRLTLDYREDLEMFDALYKKLDKKKLKPNLKNVFKVLDKNPEISSLNSHLGLKYKTDTFS